MAARLRRSHTWWSNPRLALSHAHPSLTRTDIRYLNSRQFRERPVAPRGDSRQSNEPASGITPGVVPWPAPIGEAGMFGLAGDFVRLVQKDTEADPNILLLTFLVYAGNMLGRTVYSTAGGDKHCTNLYLSIVGTTSHGRKGSSALRCRGIFLARRWWPRSRSRQRAVWD